MNYVSFNRDGKARAYTHDDLAALPHTAVEQACKAAVATDPIAAIYRTITDAKAGRLPASPMDAARTAHLDMVRASVLRLSFHDQMAIVRSIAMAHSEYAGSDDLVAGAESMAEDFRVDILGHDGPAYFESERQVWS